MNYRKEINGLRAIAVLAVLVYHFTPQFLPHGYLGVDLFFVISGYLITQIIGNELATKKFSFSAFYLRRIRRILPATLTVLITSTFVAFAILLAPDLIRFAKSLASALGFSANIYFWRTGGYFGTNEQLKPLLHLWSLGVEEQFYLILPLFLFVVFKLTSSNYARQLALIAVVAISYGLNLYLNKIGGENPAFFLLPTRIWQFGLGAFFALTPVNLIKKEKLNDNALILLLASLIFTIYAPIEPLPKATVPSLCIALLMAMNWSQSSVSKKLLSLNPIQTVGKISFSLYLWHWPILAFLRYVNVAELSNHIIAGGVISTFILSHVSWKYIEEPFRKKISTQKVFIFVGISYALLISSVLGIILFKGFPERDSNEANTIASAIDTNFRCDLSSLRPYGASRACFFTKNTDANYTTVLLGNSHAQMYAPALVQALKETGKNGFLVPLNGCLPTTTLNISEDCLIKAKVNLDSIIQDEMVDTVVIALTWHPNQLIGDKGKRLLDVDYKLRDQSLLELITKLKVAGKSVYLVGPIAIPEFDFASNTSRQLKFGNQNLIVTKTSRKSFDATYQKSIAYFQEHLDKNFLLPHELLCDKTYCYFSDQNGAYFADNNHLGVYGVSKVNTLFKKINSPRD